MCAYIHNYGNIIHVLYPSLFFFHHCAFLEGGEFMDEMINKGEIQTARPTLDFSRRSLLKS